MTGQEQRVAEHLRAYAGGLPVSQNDINLAQEILHDRLDERSARQTRTRLVLAVAAALVVSVGAAVALRDGTDGSAPPPAGETSDLRAPAGEAPTVDALTGVWKFDGEHVPNFPGETLLLRFGADGTFSFDNTGQLDAGLSGAGTFRIDGSTVWFTALDGPYCPVRSTYGWQVGLPEPGRMQTVLSEPPVAVNLPTADRCSLGGEQTDPWIRLSPRSPAGALLSADGAEAGELLPPLTEIYGIWLQQGTGRLLAIGRDGTYYVDDGGGGLITSPDDTGAFERSGVGGVLLTAEAGSRECAPGDTSTWQDVRIDSARTGLSVGSEESTCQGRASLAGTWVSIATPTGGNFD